MDLQCSVDEPLMLARSEAPHCSALRAEGSRPEHHGEREKGFQARAEPVSNEAVTAEPKAMTPCALHCLRPVVGASERRE